MYAVLCRLKGPKGAHYAEMELKKLTDGKLLHWYWELFATEIEGVFRPQLQQDWAHNALKKLKQTDNMSMVTFIVEFMKLKYYAKTDDGAAIRYLEDNVHPCIRYQLFSMGWHSSDYNATLTAIKEIGANLEERKGQRECATVKQQVFQLRNRGSWHQGLPQAEEPMQQVQVPWRRSQDQLLQVRRQSSSFCHGANYSALGSFHRQRPLCHYPGNGL